MATTVLLIMFLGLIAISMRAVYLEDKIETFKRDFASEITGLMQKSDEHPKAYNEAIIDVLALLGVRI